MNHLTEEQINEYVDRLLTDAEAEAVEQHLLVCAACQEKVDEIQRVFTALADLPEVPFQKNLTARVLAASGLQLVEPPPTTVPARVLSGWVAGLTWTIAALQVPLAGLALVYAWPMLRAWLAPVGSFFSQPWQGLALVNGWNANGTIQLLLVWSSQIQQSVRNLSTLLSVPTWSTQEGVLILAGLLATWAAGNYLLFSANRNATHSGGHYGTSI